MNDEGHDAYHYAETATNPIAARGPREAKLKARFKKGLILILVACAVLGISGSVFLYMQHQKDQKIIKASSGAASQSDVAALVRKVSRLMLLPAHERPTIATVSNSRKLPRQVFFQHARNGDRLLIYAKAKTAVLYDPKKDLVVAVSPLSTGPAH